VGLMARRQVLLAGHPAGPVFAVLAGMEASQRLRLSARARKKPNVFAPLTRSADRPAPALILARPMPNAAATCKTRLPSLNSLTASVAFARAVGLRPLYRPAALASAIPSR